MAPTGSRPVTASARWWPKRNGFVATFLALESLTTRAISADGHRSAGPWFRPMRPRPYRMGVSQGEWARYAR